MPASPFDSAIYGALFNDPEIADLFSDSAEIRALLRVLGELARAQGDLSENAEYDAAKDAQGHLEARIAKLETTVGNARVIDESSVDNSSVRILSKVRVMNREVKKESHYTIVAAAEASFEQGKISVDSPIGRGLLGKAVGDKVEINVPAGKIKLEVLEISR